MVAGCSCVRFRPRTNPLIHEFLRHVTMQDLRLRFFAPMKEFTHEFIAR